MKGKIIYIYLLKINKSYFKSAQCHEKISQTAV